MKTTTLILTLLALIVATPVFAMFEETNPSPRARAMGGVYSSLSDDSDGIFYNPAGLALAPNEFRFGYSQLYNLDWLQQQNFSMSYTPKPQYGVFALGAKAFDTSWEDEDLYAERVYTIGHGFCLMKDVHSELYLGYNVELYHVDIKDFGNEAAVGVGFGMLARLHQRIRLGFSVSNANGAAIGENQRHEIPQKLTAGLSYEPYPGVTTTVELRKVMNTPTDGGDVPTELHTGVEMILYDMFALRMGLSTEPNSYSVGAGFDVKGILVNYAWQTHEVLDGTHHFGIGYKF